jgi:hypothetical protein
MLGAAERSLSATIVADRRGAATLHLFGRLIGKIDAGEPPFYDPLCIIGA